jgi:hypothetical protein
MSRPGPVAPKISAQNVATIRQILVGDEECDFPKRKADAINAIDYVINLPGNAIFHKEVLPLKKAVDTLKSLTFPAISDNALSKLGTVFTEIINSLTPGTRSIPCVNLALAKLESLSKNFSVNLQTFISAQKDIVLGFHERFDSLQDLPGLPFRLWSSYDFDADQKNWGPVFRDRVAYVMEHRGSITFYGKAADPTNNISEEKVAIALKIWRSLPEDDIREMFKAFVEKFTSTMGGEEGQKISCGAITYFELAFLLANKVPFRAEEFSFDPKSLYS